jgi:hypothetical protein
MKNVTIEQMMLEHAATQTALLTQIAFTLALQSKDSTLMLSMNDLVMGANLLDEKTAAFSQAQGWKEL